MIAALIGLLSLPVAAPAIPSPQPVQVSPDVCFSAALADLDRIEWNARNADLVLGNASMNQLLGAASDYSAEQIAEAERDRQAGPAKIAAARAEVARWRAAGGRTSPGSTTYTPAQLDALLAACAAAPVISRSPTPVSMPTSASYPTFSRLDGQDPAGFDLGSVEVAPRDYDTCRDICAADSRCMAFNVYTPAPADKGFCWLKHRAGPTRPDPASISGVRADPSSAAAASVLGVSFDRFDRRDAAGNDIGMVEVPARDYQRCSALCAANERCRAFNLYTPAPHDKSFCWLKHSAGPMRDDPNSVTGVRSTPASRSIAPQIAQERWIFKANAGGGGFGWRQPSEGSIPATVEVISRSSTPIMIAGREARWSYYTVRLDCVAQTTTVTSHLITTDAGERIVDVPEGPKPINSDTPPQAAGMVICNRAAFPDSRTANSREEMLAALRGSATAARGSTTSMALTAPPTVWEGQYMSALEPLYVLAPDAPNAAFYRSLSRPAANGRHEMWVVAVLRGVSTDPGGSYDLGASLYSIDCNARTTQVLRGQVYREMAPVRDTPIEPVVALQPGTVTHQMIIQVCDGGPLPAFAGSLSQVRRAVPLLSSSR